MRGAFGARSGEAGPPVFARVARCAPRLLFVFAVSFSGACGDPNLDVTFSIAPQYRDAIGTVTLRVYHPLPAAPFDCDMLAFGQVDPDALRLSLVTEISLVTTSEAPLEVDRTASKLFWAEGLDGQGRRLVTGCAQFGEVDDDTEVVIESEPTKLVTVAQRPSLSVPMGTSLTDPIVFAVTDLDARPLAGVEVRWEIDGAGGSGSSGAATTSESGNASILPAIPTRPGPFVLDVAIRWVEGDPEAVTGFVQPAAELGMLQGSVFDYRSGPIGPNAEPGFVALLDEDIAVYKVVFVYQNADGELQMRTSQTLFTNAPQLGLIEASRDGERARPIVIGLDNWIEVGADGSLTDRPAYNPPTGLAPVAIEMSTSCEPGSPPQIFVSYESDVIGIFNDDAAGNLFTTNLDLIASGCVTDQTAGVVRLMVLEDPQLNLFVAVLVGDRFFGEPWLAISNGIGFAPAIGSPRERLLLGTQLSVNEVVISRYVVSSGNETLSLVQRGLDSPNGFPLFTDGGDIDGDDLLDVVSLVDQRTAVEDPQRFAVWSALGREREGSRITGDFEISAGIELRSPEMMVIDLDRDGSDDVVVGERTPFEIGATSRFEIYRMGDLTPE
jgi:hypothetical protein